MSCKECKFANKSGNDDFVFCTFWQSKCNESGMSEEDFVRKEMFPQTTLSKVALGWGYPKKHFKLESHWVHKGTASEGLMWNNQICIHKDEHCHEHKLLDK